MTSPNSRADRQQEVRLLDPRDEGGARPGAEVAGEGRRAVVDDVLPAERTTDRQLVGLGDPRDVVAGSIVPATAADQHHRALRRGKQPPHLREIRSSGMGVHGPVRADYCRGAMVPQHILRQCQHDRARPPGGGDLKGLVDQLGDALGHVDLRHPFGKRCEHLAEIDLLEGFAVDLMACHLADQHDHRRRIPGRRYGCRSRRCTRRGRGSPAALPACR